MKHFVQIIVLLINIYLFVQCKKIAVGGLTKRGDKIYYSTSLKETWADANEFCKENSMDLLSIRSVEDTYNVKNLGYSGYFWSGGNNIKDNLVWTWSGKPENNNKFVYTNWQRDETSKVEPDANCVRIEPKYITFNNISCRTELPFVCENVDIVSQASPEIVHILSKELQDDQKPNANTKHDVIRNAIISSEKALTNDALNIDLKSIHDIEHPSKDTIKLPNIYHIIKESMLRNGKFYNKNEFTFNNSNVTFYFIN